MNRIIIHRSGINARWFLHVLDFGRGLPPIKKDQKRKTEKENKNKLSLSLNNDRRHELISLVCRKIFRHTDFIKTSKK
jgi:hypothetical protein